MIGNELKVFVTLLAFYGVRRKILIFFAIATNAKNNSNSNWLSNS